MAYGEKSAEIRKILKLIADPQTFEIQNISIKVIEIATEVNCSENLVWRLYMAMKKEFKKHQVKQEFLEELYQETKFLFTLFVEFVQKGVRKLTEKEFRKFKGLEKKLEIMEPQIEVLKELDIKV